MRVVVLKLAAFLVIYAGFALFQAATPGQPLADRLDRLGRHARTSARMLAMGCLALSSALLGPSAGWGEASLFSAVGLCLVASLFVVLAPVVPRFTWGLAIASGPLAAALAFGARWLA